MTSHFNRNDCRQAKSESRLVCSIECRFRANSYLPLVIFIWIICCCWCSWCEKKTDAQHPRCWLSSNCVVAVYFVFIWPMEWDPWFSFSLFIANADFSLLFCFRHFIERNIFRLIIRYCENTCPFIEHIVCFFFLCVFNETIGVSRICHIVQQWRNPPQKHSETPQWYYMNKLEISFFLSFYLLR